jgi:glucuronate isomerase
MLTLLLLDPTDDEVGRTDVAAFADPAARRVDCAYLARLVAEHRLGEDEAHEELAYTLAKKAYRL